MPNQLENILKELTKNTEFSTEYDIKIHKTITAVMVRVMRKKAHVEEKEKYTYNPSVLIDYNKTNFSFGFDIYYNNDYLFYGTLRIVPVEIYSVEFDKHEFGRRLSKVKVELYKKNFVLTEIDFDDIIKYIINTEYKILFANETNFIPSNEWRCTNCNKIIQKL